MTNKVDDPKVKAVLFAAYALRDLVMADDWAIVCSIRRDCNEALYDLYVQFPEVERIVEEYENGE